MNKVYLIPIIYLILAGIAIYLVIMESWTVAMIVFIVFLVFNIICWLFLPRKAEYHDYW